MKTTTSLADYLSSDQKFTVNNTEFIVTGTHETRTGWQVDVKNLKNKKQSTMAYDELCLILKNQQLCTTT